jgi:hypothetical protein
VKNLSLQILMDPQFQSSRFSHSLLNEAPSIISHPPAKVGTLIDRDGVVTSV